VDTQTLDLGCGSVASAAIGVDVSRSALRQRGGGVCACGEQLPFRDGTFRRVVSLVAVPYMDLPAVMRELRRVLVVGGVASVKLHPWTYALRELMLYPGSARNIIYRLYVLLNGLLLHLTGRCVRLPNGRIESFQTRRGMELAAAKANLMLTVIVWDTHCVSRRAGNCWVELVRV
jgi:SAM-dependent methyltransferase